MSGAAPRPEPPWEPTERLLARARSGDRSALNVLFARYRPALTRLAHGRVPAIARGLEDTQDIVQSVVLKALKHVGRFEPRYPGAFHFFLRAIMLNQIREANRKAKRRPVTAPISDDVPGTGPSPLDEAIARDLLCRYEKFLKQLTPEQAEAMVLHELGFTYAEIAEATGLENANAARMRVVRAIQSLSKLMGRHR